MNVQDTRRKIMFGLIVALAIIYLWLVVSVGPVKIIGVPILAIPDLGPHIIKTDMGVQSNQPNDLGILGKDLLEYERQQIIEKRRAVQINKVKRFFRAYGAKLQGYEHIFVDVSERCGGDYRVLVGIAGSESGLGRVNVLKYNPFGYLNGVQYKNQTEALKILGCKVSEQHISKCGTDLYCLGRRYAGPKDDLDHFVSKVRWFFNQVD